MGDADMGELKIGRAAKWQEDNETDDLASLCERASVILFDISTESAGDTPLPSGNANRDSDSFGNNAQKEPVAPAPPEKLVTAGELRRFIEAMEKPR